MKKRIAKIAAAASIVACLGTVSAMAVVDAICEHKNTYIDKVIDYVISSELFGHTYHYIGNVICSDCGEVLSSYEDSTSDSHDFSIFVTQTSEEVVDENGFHSTKYITIWECSVCGWYNEVVEDILH